MSNVNTTRINNDVNGNPRYVVHHLAFVNDLESHNKHINTSQRYELAVLRANSIGARKFHNKQYGGGIMWSTYGCIAADIDSAFSLFENGAVYSKALRLVDKIKGSTHLQHIKGLFDKYTVENSWRGGAFPYVMDAIAVACPGRHSYASLFIATCLLAIEVEKECK